MGFGDVIERRTERHQEKTDINGERKEIVPSMTSSKEIKIDMFVTS